jgi:hypothetical protein
VVASGGKRLPVTVQDAVLWRAYRLSPQARLALRIPPQEPSTLTGGQRQLVAGQQIQPLRPG